MAERVHKHGRAYLRFTCGCGQKQDSPEPADGPVKCARCGAEHTADG